MVLVKATPRQSRGGAPSVVAGSRLVAVPALFFMAIILFESFCLRHVHGYREEILNRPEISAERICSPGEPDWSEGSDEGC